MGADIGIIGGSGLYELEGFEAKAELHIDTPFGRPSDALVVGELGGQRVAFLSRHGRGHLKAPHEINYRANIWALKSLGVRWTISVSAVGSMREEIVPGDLVLVDQFIDRTRSRVGTFFEDGIAGHVAFAEPCCHVLRSALDATCRAEELPFHPRGTYVCIDGPQFSTRAESLLFRGWGVEVVGMTNLPEARLAREAQMAYTTVAMATDYDCWHEAEEDVTVEGVLTVMRQNVAKAKQLLSGVMGRIPSLPPSPAWNALAHAVMTADGAIPENTRRRLAVITAPPGDAAREAASAYREERI